MTEADREEWYDACFSVRHFASSLVRLCGDVRCLGAAFSVSALAVGSPQNNMQQRSPTTSGRWSSHSPSTRGGESPSDDARHQDTQAESHSGRISPTADRGEPLQAPEFIVNIISVLLDERCISAAKMRAAHESFKSVARLATAKSFGSVSALHSVTSAAAATSKLSRAQLGAILTGAFNDASALSKFIDRVRADYVSAVTSRPVPAFLGELDYYSDPCFLRYCLLALFEHVDWARQRTVSWGQLVLFLSECSTGPLSGEASSTPQRQYYLPAKEIHCRELFNVTSLFPMSSQVERLVSLSVAKSGRSSIRFLDAVTLSHVNFNGNSISGGGGDTAGGAAASAGAEHQPSASALDEQHTRNGIDFDSGFGAVMCMAAIPDHTLIACAFFDAIRLVDGISGTLKGVLAIEATVSAVRWCPSLRMLVSGDREGGVSDYSLQGVERQFAATHAPAKVAALERRRTHTDSVTDILEECPSKLTITCGMDGAIGLFHRESRTTRVIRGMVTLRVLLVPALGYLFSHGVDLFPALWPYNVPDAKPMILGGKTKPHLGRIIGLGVIRESGLGVSVDRAGTAKVWDLAQGVCVQTISAFFGAAASQLGFLFDLCIMRTAPGRQFNLLLSSHRRVFEFAYNHGDFGRCPVPKASATGAPIAHLLYVPESQALLSIMGRDVTAWNIVSGQRMGMPFPVLSDESIEKTVAYSIQRDGDGESRRNDLPKVDRVVSAALDRELRTLTVASSSGVVGVYSVGSGAERVLHVTPLSDLTNVTLTSSGSALISHAAANPQILLPATDRSAPFGLRRVQFSTAAQSVRVRLVSYHPLCNALITMEDVDLTKGPPESVSLWAELPSGSWGRMDSVKLFHGGQGAVGSVDPLRQQPPVAVTHIAAFPTCPLFAVGTATGVIFLLRIEASTPSGAGATGTLGSVTIGGESSAAAAAAGGTAVAMGAAASSRRLHILGSWCNTNGPGGSFAFPATCYAHHPKGGGRLIYCGDDQGMVRLFDLVELVAMQSRSTYEAMAEKQQAGERRSKPQGSLARRGTGSRATRSRRDSTSSVDHLGGTLNSTTASLVLDPDGAESSAGGLTPAPEGTLEASPPGSIVGAPDVHGTAPPPPMLAATASYRGSNNPAPRGSGGGGIAPSHASSRSLLPSRGLLAPPPPPSATSVHPLRRAWLIALINAHPGEGVASLAWIASHRGGFVASGGVDGHIHFWTPFLKTRLATLFDHSRLPPLRFVPSYPPMRGARSVLGPKSHDAHGVWDRNPFYVPPTSTSPSSVASLLTSFEAPSGIGVSQPGAATSAALPPTDPLAATQAPTVVGSQFADHIAPPPDGLNPAANARQDGLQAMWLRDDLPTWALEDVTGDRVPVWSTISQDENTNDTSTTAAPESTTAARAIDDKPPSRCLPPRSMNRNGGLAVGHEEERVPMAVTIAELRAGMTTATTSSTSSEGLGGGTFSLTSLGVESLPPPTVAAATAPPANNTVALDEADELALLAQPMSPGGTLTIVSPDAAREEALRAALQGATKQKALALYRDWAYGLQERLVRPPETNGGLRRLTDDLVTLHALSSTAPSQQLPLLLMSPDNVRALHKVNGPPTPRQVTLPPVNAPIRREPQLGDTLVALPPQGATTRINQLTHAAALVRATHEYKESLRQPKPDPTDPRYMPLPKFLSAAATHHEMPQLTPLRMTGSGGGAAPTRLAGLTSPVSSASLFSAGGSILSPTRGPVPASLTPPPAIRHRRAAGGAETVQRVPRYATLRSASPPATVGVQSGPSRDDGLPMPYRSRSSLPFAGGKSM